MQLDTPTLAAVSVLGGLMFAVAMGGVWLAGTRERCVVSWALAGLGSATGYLVGASASDPRLAPVNWVAIAMANGLIGLSHALIFFGVRQFLGRRTPILPICAAIALLFAAALVSDELRTSLRSRVLFQSAAYIVLDVAAAVSLLRIAIPGLRAVQGVVAAVLLGYAGFLAAHWFWLFFHPGVGDADPVQAAVLPVTLVFNLLLSTCIVLLLYRRKELELRALARIDALTGLENRAALGTQSAIEISRARRYGDPLSVVMVDLDHFKHINDTHGHAVGDAVLRSAARVLESDLRDTDRAFRIGGEQYLLVLPKTPGDTAARIAERLRARFEATPIATTAGPLAVSASFGVAELDAAEDWLSLLERTDRALSSAKHDGRNCVRCAIGIAPRPVVFRDEMSG